MGRAVRQIWKLSILLIITLSWIIQPATAWAQPAPQASVVQINSPGNSAIVSGTVPVTGTAVDPDFKHYVLEFAPDPAVGDVWYAIQPPVAQQVRDGVLGAWNTTFVEDGRYLIRLRVVRNDDTEQVDEVRVFVVNATATPTLLPTATATLTPTPDTSSPGGEPSATPLIWQPPTRTPRPASAANPPTPTPRSLDLTEGPFQSGRLRRAAWRGVQITLGVFAALGLYALAKSPLRRYFRTAFWLVQQKVINPLAEGIARRRNL